ncbi:MAG: hypothetical protein VB106_01600 [Clostridiaceae bacterium]|nr:hypothetical protein [Clostridiaceae bacterium]
MKDYKVKLVSMGALTQLPDSQKLFGALVYMFSEEYGSEKASMLTKALLDKKIYLALSNVMPFDYFPTPKDYLIDFISESASKEDKLKEKSVAIKKRSYIKSEELERVLDKPEDCYSVFPYVELQNQQQLRASIESIRYDIPELDSKLYSVPTIALSEISLDKESKEQKKSMNKFHFYLQVDDSNIGADLLDMLKEAAGLKQTVILGKRASQGLNTFEFSDIIEQDFRYTPTSLFLNMGMLLPNEIDFVSSKLKLFTSERRPFEVTGGWDKDFTKHYISFIAEGSIISAPSGFVAAGKSIKSCFNENRDIVFGNAFLYPILSRERRV